MTAHQSFTANDLHVGDIVRVTLAENPTTGYRWNFSAGSERTDALQILQDRYESPNTNLVGAGGKRIITLRVN